MTFRVIQARLSLCIHLPNQQIFELGAAICARDEHLRDPFALVKATLAQLGWMQGHWHQCGILNILQVMSRGGDDAAQILQYVKASLVFEVVQHAAARALCDQQCLTLIKDWVQVDTVRANFRANHRTKKRVATGHTGGRQTR